MSPPPPRWGHGETAGHWRAQEPQVRIRRARGKYPYLILVTYLPNGPAVSQGIQVASPPTWKLVCLRERWE
jgi:hypothetical protein